MSSTQPLPPKKEVALALLERSSVHLHLDPRAEGAVVPPGFKKQPQLVLQIGLNMPVPIPDLRLDDDGMSCTLSFSRSPFFCVVPWSSVFAIVGDDGRGMVWPDDVPPEVAQQSARAAEGRSDTRAEGRDGAREPAKRPQIAAVARVADEAPSSKGKRPRKKPQLAAAPEPAPDSVPTPPVQRIAPASADGHAGRSGAAESHGNEAHASPRAPQQRGAGQRAPLRPQPAAGAQGKKPKRELPPYLRVVK